ncbi:DIP1984 family protein [Corynebacterium lizhenjunii]|uniref:DIP1984 family protein n=1 Tax=Corynebacterium lizhenjunii TaxID=2709394 RepID=A0A7T0PBB0_9CORY|nr:DIP1984 family protein [Corynebacterium lizhenjunii]QPK79245.1 DIP1984 family protein [Corynebacterium lizhenjunii]
MYLAEALAERAEAQARLAQLHTRLHNNAQIQEGDAPTEDPAALLAEAEGLLERIDQLVRAINATNVATRLGSETLADALARRTTLLKRRQLYAELADAASARQDRYSRSEIKYVPTLDVAALRAQADQAAKEFRILDSKIQQANWLTEMVD